MSEIEGGDKVITPEGEIKEVIMAKDDHCKGVKLTNHPNRWWPPEDLLKVDAPIRVRVSRKCYAESLVEMAEEVGFEPFCGWDYEKHGLHKISGLEIDPKKMVFYKKSISYELTYTQDLPQIEAWLEYHSESEDECEQSNFTQEVFEKMAKSATEELRAQKGLCIKCGKNEASKPDYICPDCTDDSEEKPDEYIPSTFKRDTGVPDGEVTKNYNTGEVIDSNESEGNQSKEQWMAEQYSKSEDEDLVSGLSEKPAYHLQIVVDYIRELEQQLSDCREELDEVRKERDQLKSKVEQWEESTKGMMVVPPSWVNKNGRDKLQERIEEAREWFEQNKLIPVDEPLPLHELYNILFGSDEGDG